MIDKSHISLSLYQLDQLSFNIAILSIYNHLEEKGFDRVHVWFYRKTVLTHKKGHVERISASRDGVELREVDYDLVDFLNQFKDLFSSYRDYRFTPEGKLVLEREIARMSERFSKLLAPVTKKWKTLPHSHHCICPSCTGQDFKCKPEPEIYFTAKVNERGVSNYPVSIYFYRINPLNEGEWFVEYHETLPYTSHSEAWENRANQKKED